MALEHCTARFFICRLVRSFVLFAVRTAPDFPHRYSRAVSSFSCCGLFPLPRMSTWRVLFSRVVLRSGNKYRVRRRKDFGVNRSKVDILYPGFSCSGMIWVSLFSLPPGYSLILRRAFCCLHLMPSVISSLALFLAGLGLFLRIHTTHPLMINENIFIFNPCFSLPYDPTIPPRLATLPVFSQDLTLAY